MATIEERQVRAATAHPEEWFSIGLAVIATAAAALFMAYFPNFEPATGLEWALPVWCGITYLILQLAFLLFSANDVRAIGVLDSALAGLPVVVGLVILSQFLVNKNFHMSDFQLDTLAVLIVTGASEFMLTLWIRFVINRRTIGVDNS